jgi:hypothetical protein
MDSPHSEKMLFEALKDHSAREGEAVSEKKTICNA